MRAVVLCGLALLLTACNAGPKVVIQEQDDTSPATKPAPVANWEYKTDGASYWACARSVDNAAEICFRKEQGHLDSYLHLPSREGNPFFCQRGRCPTKLQADGGPEQTVQGTDDESGGTRILFLPDSQKLLHEVQQAKELRVRPPMFGIDQAFVFQVSGLKWK
jgi:hypothetical protein